MHDVYAYDVLQIQYLIKTYCNINRTICYKKQYPVFTKLRQNILLRHHTFESFSHSVPN